jgi:hypothetical protein
MTKNSQDELIRAYAMLSSLRKNIEQKSSPIPEKYVHEYHTVLDRLEGMGIDISEFRIPDSEVKSHTVASMYIRGNKQWSTEVIGVEKSFILYKIDAILGYFEIISSEKPKRIGFHTPESK